MITRFERFTLILFEIMKYWNKIASEIMKDEQLKGTHALYIITLYRFPEGLSAARLTDICQKDKAEISRSLATLETKGFVCKDGEALACHLNEIANTAVQQASQSLSKEEREIMYKCLSSIAENLRTISKEDLTR
ncbi:MarR family transcriptional regulator [Dubosiella newyorkensis]|jgi:DNA-binding MarR family transcriptional regulator|uniref:MarR family transcriptional regulator n=1 Tax=Dubosiella newyorkensis TaxID=1862672 RepID=UPI002352DD3B|nr:helix-turn-helix domain-containing protein [Dubosiella newyorkensis]MCI9042099.1 MarR family transcriptional regulator [Dubosiella newyorkensis]